MHLEAVLDKLRVMVFVIRNIKMVLHQYICLRVREVQIGVVPISYVNKNAHLIRVPVHTLHFILNLELVILSIVNNRDYCVFRERLATTSELLVLPPRNKIVSNKSLKFWLQVI